MWAKYWEVLQVTLKTATRALCEIFVCVIDTILSSRSVRYPLWVTKVLFFVGEIKKSNKLTSLRQEVKKPQIKIQQSVYMLYAIFTVPTYLDLPNCINKTAGCWVVGFGIALLLGPLGIASPISGNAEIFIFEHPDLQTIVPIFVSVLFVKFVWSAAVLYHPQIFLLISLEVIKISQKLFLPKKQLTASRK